MLSLKKLRPKLFRFLEQYGVLVAGVVIFLYYLWAAIDLFSHPNARTGFSGYFIQFSSVLMLWGLLFLGAKLFEYKKGQKEAQEKSLSMLQEYERRRMQLELLDEVSMVLNDSVNNPLAVISLSATSIRERFKPDSEILAYLDRIDAALRRVRDVLSDLKSYETSKIVKSIQDLPSPHTRSSSERVLMVDQKGEIKSE